jgi:hypothetical protein
MRLLQKFKRWLEWTEHIQFLSDLLDLFSWRRAMIAGLLAIAAAIRAWAENQPLSFVLVLGLAGFVVALLAANGVLWFQERLRNIANKPTIMITKIEESAETYKLYGTKRVFELEINNTGPNLDNCLCKITHISAMDATTPHVRHLPRALLTSRNAERYGSGPFHLRTGEPKRIPFCSRLDGRQQEICFSYEGTPDPHWSYSLRGSRSKVGEGAKRGFSWKA